MCYNTCFWEPKIKLNIIEFLTIYALMVLTSFILAQEGQATDLKSYNIIINFIIIIKINYRKIYADHHFVATSVCHNYYVPKVLCK